MKTAFVEKITAPVKSGELIFAWDVIQAVGTGNRTGAQGGALRFVRGLHALKQYIQDEGKAGSLNTRAWALNDLLSDERIQPWRKGEYIHNSLFVVAAEMPMTDHGEFDAGDFFRRVEETVERFSDDQIKNMLKDGARELPQNLRPVPEPQYWPEQTGWQVEQRIGIPRIGRNEPCPCGSGKKYKKCHGAN
jgi:hypothetical protein